MFGLIRFALLLLALAIFEDGQVVLDEQTGAVQHVPDAPLAPEGADVHADGAPSDLSPQPSALNEVEGSAPEPPVPAEFQWSNNEDHGPQHPLEDSGSDNEGYYFIPLDLLQQEEDPRPQEGGTSAWGAASSSVGTVGPAAPAHGRRGWLPMGHTFRNFGLGSCGQNTSNEPTVSSAPSSMPESSNGVHDATLGSAASSTVLHPEAPTELPSTPELEEEHQETVEAPTELPLTPELEEEC